MQILFFINVLLGLVAIRVNGEAFSHLLARGLGEYFKSLVVTNSPEPTTTIKSEQNEQKSYNLQEFSSVELRTVDLATIVKINFF